ncbi:MAG TPA: ABC transporter permease, partial [Streptomyces sp.]|nr:ABC transporter permease [Streptomyces sp.]
APAPAQAEAAQAEAAQAAQAQAQAQAPAQQNPQQGPPPVPQQVQPPAQGQPYGQPPTPPQQQAQQVQQQAAWQGPQGPQNPQGSQAPQGFQGGTYISPIPVGRTHLGHALASEWTKIRTVRSTVWTLAVMASLVVGIGFLASAATDTTDYVTDPPITNGLFGLLLGQICVITLGVLVVTSEYGTGMIRTTLTAAPKRSRVLAAKALVFFAVSWTVTTVVCTLSALIGAGLHSGPGVAEATGGQWAGATAGAGLYVSLLGMLALAVGSMLRHSAGAITTMLGVVLLPAIIPAFMMFSESLRPAAEKILEYNAINSLASIHQVTGEGNGMNQLLLLAVVTTVAFAGAFALLEKRDV